MIQGRDDPASIRYNGAGNPSTNGGPRGFQVNNHGG